jgi:hypothetical protein
MMRRGFIASAHSGSFDVRPRASQLRASVDQGLAMTVEFYAKTLGKTITATQYQLCWARLQAIARQVAR